MPSVRVMHGVAGTAIFSPSSHGCMVCNDRVVAHDMIHEPRNSGRKAHCQRPFRRSNQRRRTYHDLMNAAPSPADWSAWWSWPWRAASVWTSPPPSLTPQTLTQPILPGWLFANSISVNEENSSSPQTEQDIVAAHSYGQQLGRILDVLDELLKERPAGAPDTRPVREFVKLRTEIDAIKARQSAKRAEQMISDLADMKQSNPGEYQHLATELRKFLDGSGE